jgi:hypothetical protein
MSAFDRMVGKSGDRVHQHLDGSAKVKESAGNNAALAMLSKFIPGFDPSMIDKMGADVQQTVTWFKEHVENIEAQNREILSNQALILARLSEQPNNDSPF